MQDRWLVNVLSAGVFVGAWSSSEAGPPCVTRQELTVRSAGVVETYHVSNGQEVKKGDLIVELDSRLLSAAVSEARGAVEASHGQVELARDAVRRLSKLKGSDAISEQQLTEAKIRLTQALATEKQATGALERIQVQLEDAQIRAKIAGIVQGLPSIIGMGVQPGQSLGRIEAKVEQCPKSR